MKHHASPDFWAAYRQLTRHVQLLADKNFALVKVDPKHPSLYLKKVGRFISVGVGRNHRALAMPVEDGLLWFWIGTHATYDKLLK
jgi:hypothetical protein